jgi:hypothetical protein
LLPWRKGWYQDSQGGSCSQLLLQPLLLHQPLLPHLLFVPLLLLLLLLLAGE